MMDLKEIGQRAKDASYILGTMDSQRKNEGLRAAASELSGRREEILRANEEDLRLAREKGMAQGLLDRLLLTPERIEGIVTGMAQVIDLEAVSYTHLAREVFFMPYAAFALKTLAPTVWIMAYLGVFRGYYQGQGTMVPWPW